MTVPPIFKIESLPESPNELDFVDPDIAEIFRGKGNYFNGHPTIMQLVKELRLLRTSVEILERKLVP